MNRADRGDRRALGLAALSGLLLALSYPRPGWWWLAFPALTPLLFALRSAGWRRALRLGYACGIVFFSILLYWIAAVMVSYGGLAWASGVSILALLVAYLAGYVALFAVLVAASWRRFGPPGLLAAPFVWVGCELVRGRLLTGFPWGLLGYSQSPNLPLLQAAALGGIHLVSFVVAVAATGLALVLAGSTRPQKWAGVACLGAVVAAHVLGAAFLEGEESAVPQAPEVRVAAVQGNVAQDVKWDPDAAGAIVADLERLTRQAADAGARLVVWPESSSPLSLRRPRRGTGGEVAVEVDAAYADRLAALARGLQITLILGSVDYRVDGSGLRAYNSAVVVTPDGAQQVAYDKVHLVPFGEYVPLARVLFFVDRMVQGAIAAFAPGDRMEPVPTAAGGAATFICYEAIFPELVRRLARHDAAILVNITNDAWFGTSAAPHQHLAMAAVRAVENRRWLVRAANTGISALVDPYGRIVARTPLMVRTVVIGAVRPATGTTPYARAGDVTGYACAIVTFFLAVALRAAAARRDRGLGAPERPASWPTRVRETSKSTSSSDGSAR